MESCWHKDTWFSREVCPDPCGKMHNYCTDCGLRMEGCPLEEEALRHRAVYSQTLGTLKKLVKDILELLDDLPNLDK